MMLWFPEHCTSRSGLNVDLNVVEAVYFIIICSECVILYKYQFVIPSSDTATFKAMSHVHNFSPHPR